MNNFMISLKRFFTNKNTITIIGVVIVLGILYYGYSSTIKKAVDPVRVPVAASNIEPQTEITKSDIKWIEVPKISKSDNVLLNTNSIIGKYTGVNSMIPEGSMFYADAIISKEDLPGSWLKLLDEDEIPLYFNVNLTSTYSNAIQPGDYIDVYMKAEDEAGLIMYGKLMENINIKAVKDSSGEDVFKSSNETGTPSYLYFGVTDEFYILLTKANLMQSFNVELAIVPHGGANPIKGDVELTSEYLRDYIDANTLTVPQDEKKEKVDEDGNAVEKDDLTVNVDEENDNVTNEEN